MIRKRQLFNEKTGELFENKDEHFTDSLNEEGYRFPSHKRGCRIFADVHLPKEVTWSDKGRIRELGLYYVVGTSMLGYRQGREIKAYTAQEIGELVGLTGSHSRSFVARMCKLRVMLRVVTHSGAQFFLNPAYSFANGQRLSLELFLLFKDELTPLLPAWVLNEFLRQARDKGIKTPRVLAEAEALLSEGR
jgi:hypothetical protein